VKTVQGVHGGNFACLWMKIKTVSDSTTSMEQWQKWSD